MSGPSLEQVQACLVVLAAACAAELAGSPRNPHDFHRAVQALDRLNERLDRAFGLQRELVSTPVRKRRGRFFRQVA